jgi:hypothetical protein
MFVKDIADSREDRAIIEAVTKLGHALGIMITAGRGHRDIAAARTHPRNGMRRGSGIFPLQEIATQVRPSDLEEIRYHLRLGVRFLNHRHIRHRRPLTESFVLPTAIGGYTQCLTKLNVCLPLGRVR